MSFIDVLMGFLPIIIYAAVTVVIIIIYKRKRKVKEEEYFRPFGEAEQIPGFYGGVQLPPPQLKQKTGYTAPVIGIVIGALFSINIIGIFVLVISLVVLASRVNFNKRVDSWNMLAMMKYDEYLRTHGNPQNGARDI